jgi:Domain of unknown function (DUF4426)
MKIRIPCWLAACFAMLSILGCGDGGNQQVVAPAMPSDETFKEQGDYEVHFNALRTDTLTQEVARAYGIQRSSNRVMLNVAILHKEAPNAPRKPVEGQVEVDAYNLNGQLKNMEVRRVSEGEAIYYIGEVSISGSEILVFDMTVTPSGETTPIQVKFKREFHSS